MYLAEEAFLARRQALSMMRHVWRNYETHAFARDELRPVSGKGQDSWGGIGQTLVDALDTLWLMGFREALGHWGLVQVHIGFREISCA
ncbi:MNS1 [Symbiodinium natans]|uniref:alpha-1,2-Mannosidase n=1 Tax=Symbiodinium natans TaxID=878477 RepID=A0A812M9B8_9DINO|nr:MNS1 [Symbiodinium natans]